jgi:hypothetical protein
MPVPNLLHPARITLVQRSPGTTEVDVDAREPIQSAAYVAAVNIQGQPRFKSLGMAAQYHRGGPVIETDGYVLFRYVDLAAASITLAHGDRITQIGHLVVDIYIERLEPTAPYPDQGGNTMVKAHCKDRAPSRGVA